MKGLECDAIGLLFAICRKVAGFHFQTQPGNQPPYEEGDSDTRPQLQPEQQYWVAPVSTTEEDICHSTGMGYRDTGKLRRDSSSKSGTVLP